jgi:hypothetical protein
MNRWVNCPGCNRPQWVRPGQAAHHLLHCVTTPFRLRLLVGTDRRIDEHHGRDESGVLEVATHHRHDRCRNENVNQRADGLPQHGEPNRGWPLLGKKVETVLLLAALHLVFRQAARRCAKCREDRLGTIGMQRPNLLIAFGGLFS